MDIVTLQKTLDEIAAEYVRRLNLRVESIDAGADSVNLSLPVTPELVHAGGVLCGQAIMSAADTAMLVAMIAKIGEFKPMTTVQMQTSFLRPVPKTVASVTVRAAVLRFGKTLSYGGVEFRGPDGKIVAHATTTYALI
jgi:uncharacterized protein (TIGR00369 family)